ncbi:MAG TPA: TonB-dependent receptor [Terriglobales bacterium]|nr:TonB-dependent receptor [Terriglobales bacterium]
MTFASKTLSVCVLALLSTLVIAQGVTTGDLRVIVRDEKGDPISNATVTARNAAKGVERATSQNADAEYRLLQLPPGNYTIIVEAAGFARLEAPDQVITVGQSRELPVALKVAGGQTIVQVNAEAELVETTRSQTTNTIDQSRIDNLPINGRNYINFTLTDSQIVRDNAPVTGAAPTSGLNMSGQRARSNLVNVDGADATDNATNGVRSTVSQEAVQEFQIITNSYAPEYGRASGGVVNIITRSGSNQFHGDVFGYLRDRAFQAVNPFSTVPNPAYTRVQAGTAFGGAIKKDKTYFFFSYEITRRHETGFSAIGQGGLGYWGLQNFDATPIFNNFFPQPFPAGTFNILATAPQAAALGSGALNPFEAAQYAILVGGSSGIALNGSYPASFAILAQAGFIPTPVNGTSPLTQFVSSCHLNPINPPASNLVCNGLPSSFQTLGSQPGNFPVFEGTSIYDLRLDHNLNSRNRLTLRASVSPSTVDGIEVNGQDQPIGQNAYSRTSQQTYRDVAGVVQDTWAISNNKVNDFRFQYARRGLSYFFSNAPGGGDVAVNIPGFAYFGREPYSYIQRVEQRYQFSDNFSLSHGRHDMKFGVDFNYLPTSATFTVNYGGVYNFGSVTAVPGLPDLTAVQAYGLGIPSYMVQGIGNPKDSFPNKPLGVFWQDSWRLRSNLTLNYGVRYDVEFPPKFPPPDALAQVGYNYLGIQKGINTDTNNLQPRIGIAWDPRGDGKSAFRASYGIFYDHPLLGLYFLGDASDGSKTGQLLFFGSDPCTGNNPSPLNLTATNVFQGILGVPGCLPPGLAQVLGYQATSSPSSPCLGEANPQRFDPCLENSPFINQGYLTSPAAFPLVSQPFGYPLGKNFVYAYSQQVNFSFERDLGHGYALSLAYNFNGGRHLNRPINANTSRGDLLVKNWQAAVADPSFAGGPLQVGTGAVPCGVNTTTGVPWVNPALVSFFRPGGLNPSLAAGFLAAGAGGCVTLAQQLLGAYGLNSSCDTSTLANCIVFSDMDANYSNGSSVYHGLTANLRKRLGGHLEFLASYTWSHAIDDSTDLQATLTPQDSYYPGLDRSTSLFDQRHRFVFSGVYQSGRLSGSSFASKVFSYWTIAPILEVGSGRPFNIITGNGDNFQFSSLTGRPNAVPPGTPPTPCGPAIPSKYSPTGFLQEPCYASFAPTSSNPAPEVTLLSLDGTLVRNAGVQPWTVFNDLRVAKRVYFGERISMDMIVDMFNLVNRFNVSSVNVLWTNAGQPTSAYDPRQFQFALKINW